FAEHYEKAGGIGKVELFATEVDEALLAKARAGVYTDRIALDVSPDRLRKYFVKDRRYYRVTKFLRNTLVYAGQDILSDPPLSHMDVISCRYLLSQMSHDERKDVLQTLYYALRPERFLFAEAPESTDDLADLFARVDKKHGIFSKIPGKIIFPCL